MGPKITAATPHAEAVIYEAVIDEPAPIEGKKNGMVIQMKVYGITGVATGATTGPKIIAATPDAEVIIEKPAPGATQTYATGAPAAQPYVSSRVSIPLAHTVYVHAMSSDDKPNTPATLP